MTFDGKWLPCVIAVLSGRRNTTRPVSS